MLGDDRHTSPMLIGVITQQLARRKVRLLRKAGWCAIRYSVMYLVVFMPIPCKLIHCLSCNQFYSVFTKCILSNMMFFSNTSI